jgi:predicted MPP superfamily phosphohydrolase
MSPPPRSLAKRWTLYGMVLLALGAAVDATLVEPNWIEVVRTVERLPMVRPFAPDLTLVHISDIHVGSLGYRERRAIDIIDDAQPDIIVLSGDLVRGADNARDLETFLGSLHARYGKFLVWGNHDYSDGVPGTWGPEVVRRAGFTLLRNSSRAIDYPGGKIVIAGLDDPITGHDNLRLAMTRVSRRDACILVSHTPEVVRSLGNWDIDLVLAGHTHGGQVRLPLVGALWVPFGTRDHLEGWFDVPPGVRLHVSRGLGWSWLPIRFFCRPTIDIITLRAGGRPGTTARSSVGQS